MKYLMATYAPAQVWDVESMGAGDKQALAGIVEFMTALNADLEASGELVSAEGLTGPQDARVVRPEGSGTVVTDGPYAETKEVLAGFWVLDVASSGRAVEIATRVVDFVHAPIELRPVGEAPDL